MQYEKHGWTLRCVLLSAGDAENLPNELKSVIGTAEIHSSDIDALWFSRSAAKDKETWEIRRLGGAPFALVEVFESDDGEETREERRKEMETRIRALASKPENRKPDD